MMFQGVMRIIYRVSDVEKAKPWYRRLLNTEPVLDKALYVIFRIGDIQLGLVHTDQDVKELIAHRRASASSEPSRFGIIKGGIASFLSEKGYKVIDHLTPQDMEKKYLPLRDGSSAGKVAAIFCFVHASVSG